MNQPTYFINEIKTKRIKDNSYIDHLQVVKYLNTYKNLSVNNQVVFFVGENGTGKSTLIEAIAVCAGFNAEGGSKNFHFSTRQTVSNLHKYIILSKEAYEKDGFFLRAESFYNVASEVDQLEVSGYGSKSLHNQSHGESFMSLIQNRFRGNGLYILDEPESALSPSRQMALLIEIKRLADAGSQFIIATHSPILLAFPGALIYEISEEGIKTVAYKDCEHVKLMREFSNNPDRFLKHLFTDEGK